LNYKQSCSSSTECAESLICLNSVCNCTSINFFWNGTYCGNSFNHFYMIIYIFVLIELFISETTKTYMQSCLTAPNDNSSCSSTKGLYCSKSGAYAGYCICSDYYYFNSSLQQCSSKKSNGMPCSNSTECRTDLGLYCSANNTCDCSYGYYWSNSTSCRLYIYLFLLFQK
jgi:hypothetical protein